MAVAIQYQARGVTIRTSDDDIAHNRTSSVTFGVQRVADKIERCTIDGCENEEALLGLCRPHLTLQGGGFDPRRHKVAQVFIDETIHSSEFLHARGRIVRHDLSREMIVECVMEDAYVPSDPGAAWLVRLVDPGEIDPTPTPPDSWWWYQVMQIARNARNTTTTYYGGNPRMPVFHGSSSDDMTIEVRWKIAGPEGPKLGGQVEVYSVDYLTQWPPPTPAQNVP